MVPLLGDEEEALFEICLTDQDLVLSDQRDL